MNIAIVVRSLRIGGMERVAANLSDAFAERGHNVTLIYLKDKPVVIKPENKNVDIRLFNLERLLIGTGIGVIWIIISLILNIVFRKSLFVWKGFFQSGLFFRELKKIEKIKGRFDHVIVRGQGSFEMIWKINDPRFINVCENIFKEKKNGFLERFYGRILFNKKKFVCVSKGVFENFNVHMKKLGLNPAQVRIITNPINIDLIREKASLNLPEIPERKYILGLGRLVSQKNFSLLIRSYKILVDKYSSEEILVIAGDGKERSMLEELVKNIGLEKKVYFAGFTDNPYAWMAKAEVFVLSSDFEGLGMVLIEAIASGTNVVATDSPGGVRDIMNRKSLKKNLAQMDEESLAEKINSVKGSKLSLEETEEILEIFRPESIVNKYLEY